MRCDVVSILCRPGSCEHRSTCELHRPEYDKAETMTKAEEEVKGHERHRQSRAHSLGYANAESVPRRLINLINL
jgi:hypothetical protein